MLSDQERDLLRTQLDRTAHEFVDAIAGLSPGQWEFRPSVGAWSIGDIAEHVAVTEASILERVRNTLMATPAMPERSEAARGKDRLLLERVPTRNVKVQAAPELQPTRRWTLPAQVLQAFREARLQTSRYAATTDDDLRSHFAPHPSLRDLDGFQWLLLNAMHTARHVAHIEEVKAHREYPTHA